MTKIEAIKRMRKGDIVVLNEDRYRFEVKDGITYLVKYWYENNGYVYRWLDFFDAFDESHMPESRYYDLYLTALDAANKPLSNIIRVA